MKGDYMGYVEKRLFSKNNFSWCIRSATIDDASQLLELIPLIDRETEYMLRCEGEFTMSLEDEKNYIESIINGKNDLMLVAEVVESSERAIGLYKKFNFVEEGRLRKDCYYGNDKYLDTIIMAYLDI